MPYTTGMTRAQGDPGFFGSLGKIIGTIAQAVPGPIGAIAGVLGRRGGPTLPSTLPFQQAGRRPTPGIAGTIQRAVPGGATGFECPPKKRRRRIDPLNVKALRRANTRQKAFLRQVDRTLKTMPTKESVAKRRRRIASAVK